MKRQLSLKASANDSIGLVQSAFSMIGANNSNATQFYESCSCKAPVLSVTFLGIFSVGQLTLHLHKYHTSFFFYSELCDILAVVQCDIHKPERQTCSSSPFPCMTSLCLLLIKTHKWQCRKYEQNIWISITITFPLFHTRCVCGMCHTAAYPMGPVPENNTWEQSRKKRTGEFLQPRNSVHCVWGGRCFLYKRSPSVVIVTF